MSAMRLSRRIVSHSCLTQSESRGYNKCLEFIGIRQKETGEGKKKNLGPWNKARNSNSEQNGD